MGLPEINMRFETLAVSAIQRSARGIVALILKDSTKTDFDTRIYKSIDEVKAEDWTESNKDYIEKTFLGTPSKVIVERIASDAADYNTALARLKNKKWNYLAIPGILETDTDNISSWIKTERDTNKRTFKAVLPNTVADHEGIINFCTDEIVVGTKNYSTSEYTCRVAGAAAGCPFTRSLTYYKFSEVESIKESIDPNADIDAGKLILINDGEKIKIGRGVNSLTVTTVKKGAKFKKIKIVEAVDQMRDDIRQVWEDEYVGKVNNTYDNKVLFITSINAYFKELQRSDVLDPSFESKSEIDFETQKLYLQSIGVNVDTLKEMEIKRYNTGSKVFIKANGSPLDAMEDLDFSMLIA
jgi:hypothetical protein